MSMRIPLLAIVLTLAPIRAASAQQPVNADQIERAYLAAASRVPWPGFHPESIPLAIFDGTSTSLFRHPAPPADFTRGSRATAPATMLGRHPAVTANSSAEIGGRTTATVNADRPAAGTTAGQLAAVALHEAFHVFQRTHHKGWVGNEADMFTYPVDDASRLALRRLESDALRRALAATTAADAACWARDFTSLRTERFAGMAEPFPRYERLTELNEGLANYIQHRAAARSTVEFPPNEFPPASVRIRIYTVGPAIGYLLDRFAPNWKDSLDAHDTQSLDQLLAAALERTAPKSPTCEPSENDRTAARRIASADSAAIAAGRTARRAAFDARTGPRLVIIAAEGAPLWPQGFDPLNVELIDGGLLHTRFLKLGNEVATLQAIDESSADIDALSVAAGAHPLFNGVKRLELVGFGEPDIQINGTSVAVSAAGVKLTATNASLNRDGNRLTVTLAPKP